MATPERMCVGCRQMKPKPELIRLIKDKESGEPVIDWQQKILARGIYVCRSEECINQAKKKKAFERFFKNKSYDDLYDSIRSSI